MRPEAAWIGNNRRIIFQVDSGITIPQVPVDKGRFDRVATCLERSKQAWNNLSKHGGHEILELVTRPFGVKIQSEHVLQAVREKFLPCVCESVFLW